MRVTGVVGEMTVSGTESSRTCVVRGLFLIILLKISSLLGTILTRVTTIVQQPYELLIKTFSNEKGIYLKKDLPVFLSSLILKMIQLVQCV